MKVKEMVLIIAFGLELITLCLFVIVDILSYLFVIRFFYLFELIISSLLRGEGE